MPLQRGPLSDLVPAASLRWLALLKPSELLNHPELGPALAQIITPRRLDAFAEASGVDLRRLPHAAIAGFPYATLYLAEVSPGIAASAREHFEARLLAGALIKRPQANLTRITGVVGQTPETLLTIDDHALAVAVGDPLPARIAQAYAEGRLKDSPSALHGSALSTLPALTADNPVVFLAPGPFGDDWRRAAGGLLESTLAIACAVRPTTRGKMRATIYLSGGWGNEAGAAARRLATSWSAFALSSFGRLLGLNTNAFVESSPDLLTLRVELDIDPFIRGLKAAVLSDVTDFLRLPVTSASDSPSDLPSAKP